MFSASKNAGADLIRSSRLAGAAHQPRRRDESAGVEEELVAGVVGGNDDGVGGGRDARDRFTPPAARGGGLDAAGDIGQRDDQQAVLRPRVVIQGGVLVGLEYHPQFRCAGEEFVVVGRQQRTRGVCRVADIPIGAQLDQYPLAVYRHARVGGRVDANQFQAPQFVDLFVPEVERSRQKGALEARRPIHRRRDADVGAGALEDGLRLGQWSAPSPPLDHSRIAGLGEGVGAEVGAYQHGIRVGPGDLRLGLGQFEPIGDEFACQHVEFAHNGRVRATAGEADQRTGVVGFDDAGARPHPFFVVGAT